MELPTSKPNVTNAAMTYPGNLDDNWGGYMNQNFSVLADNIDTFKLTVRAKTQSIEKTVGLHFETLRESINEVALEYMIAARSARKRSMGTLKSDVDSRIEIAVNEMLSNTKDQLSEIDSIKALLLLGINRVQKNFSLTSSYVESGIDRLQRVISSEIQTTSSSKQDIVVKVKSIRDKLDDHITDYKNPHDFTASQVIEGRPQYMPDPLGHDAIKPLNVNDVITVDPDAIPVNYEVKVELNQFAPQNFDDLEELAINLSTVYVFAVDDTKADSSYLYYFSHYSSSSPNPPGSALYNRSALSEYRVAHATPFTVDLTWVGDSILREDKSFDTLQFTNDNPIAEDQATLRIYNEGDDLASPLSEKLLRITRINQTGKPTLLNNILVNSYLEPTLLVSSSSVEEIFTVDPYLRMVTDNIVSSRFITSNYTTFGKIIKTKHLFHWQIERDINGFLDHHALGLSTVPLSSAEEIFFSPPSGYKSFAQIDNWSDVEAVSFNIDTESQEFSGAAYYSEWQDLLVIVFEPGPSGLFFEYTFRFADINDPFDESQSIQVDSYQWSDVESSNNPPTIDRDTSIITGYQRIHMSSGTAITYDKELS